MMVPTKAISTLASSTTKAKVLARSSSKLTSSRQTTMIRPWSFKTSFTSSRMPVLGFRQVVFYQECQIGRKRKRFLISNKKFKKARWSKSLTQSCSRAKRLRIRKSVESSYRLLWLTWQKTWMSKSVVVFLVPKSWNSWAKLIESSLMNLIRDWRKSLPCKSWTTPTREPLITIHLTCKTNLRRSWRRNNYYTRSSKISHSKMSDGNWILILNQSKISPTRRRKFKDAAERKLSRKMTMKLTHLLKMISIIRSCGLRLKKSRRE